MNSYFSICRFEESFADFQLAFKKLRGNQLIDYKPLGLRYKLYACEVSVQEDCDSIDQIDIVLSNNHWENIFYQINWIKA